MKWRGVAIEKLDDNTLIDALRQALRITSCLWFEVARRKLVRRV